MSVTKTISVRNEIDGVLTDLTSCVLRDPTGAFGVRNVGTGAVVVAAGTAFAHDGTGLYSYPLTGLTEGATYQAYVERVYLGETSRDPVTFTAGAVEATGAYCTLAEGRAIAAALPALAKFKAAVDDVAAAALIAATLDLDAAGPWQGRKYDLATPQALEFPRVAYDSPCVIWDWDAATKAAVVPPAVKRACVYQADAILAGKLYRSLDDHAAGVASKGVGSLSVSYRSPAELAAVMAGALDGLCRLAANQMKPYRLRQGRIL